MSFLSSRTRSARQGFGKPVLRQEDPRLLAGQGCYSDDFNLPRQAYACMVRSPHAHESGASTRPARCRQPV
jgi:carbon-monoxide dehydrogenase large subunit